MGNKERITIRLEPDLIEILKKTAKKHNISYTEIMRRGTKEILKQIIDKKPTFEQEIATFELIQMLQQDNLN